MVEAILQAIISGLSVGGAYALVALGFSITFTTTKTLNFSHGEHTLEKWEAGELFQFRDFHYVNGYVFGPCANQRQN